MTNDLLAVTPEQLRTELIADLSRGGYIHYRADGTRTRYFNKYLVLSKPGLVARAAQLLTSLLPTDCERLAVTGIPSAVLGTAVAQLTGVPMLLANDHESEVRFGGETFPKVRTVLLEDVVHTGARAQAGAEALAALGVTVTSIVCLLDREAGATGRLADAGFTLRALFTEAQLLEPREHEHH